MGVTPSDAKRYNVIVNTNINEMVKTIAGVTTLDTLTSETLSQGARRYLENGGMTGAEIDALISALK